MKRICAILRGAMFVALSMKYAAHAELAPDAAAQGQATRNGQQESLYADGTKAMDEQRWPDAVTDFDRAAAINAQHSDASLYWKAYSLDKLGRKDEARATCDSLTKQQPQSPWNRECMMLTARLEYARVLAGSPRQAVHDFDLLVPNVDVAPFPARPVTSLYLHSNKPTTEDDIKILALNSLMRQDPAKAIPMLRSLLKSDKPESIREQVLFVLSRSKDPQAQALLTEVATTKG
ncbi:MAG TPA: tetratricopeptide repeat protein, partial [Acidobacteriaceae bacterium]|nr:tetratricopeptide repeat protein [Acidobacteriaceae bacterium]